MAEGGNLGLTQRARIEYARGGGKISADFIDNSGGVDCSDHEVNIKILFSILKDKKGFLKKRNEILLDLKETIVNEVLEDNKKQALLLSIEEHLALLTYY